MGKYIYNPPPKTEVATTIPLELTRIDSESFLLSTPLFVPVTAKAVLMELFGPFITSIWFIPAASLFAFVFGYLIYNSYKKDSAAPKKQQQKNTTTLVYKELENYRQLLDKHER